MTFGELLAIVIGCLDEAGIAYMITGSLAASYHGQPRATQDVDIVIDPDAGTLDRLLDALVREGFYVDRDAGLGALASRTQFNAIGSDASKVDFIIRRDRPFSVEEFARRQPADLLGTRGYVASAEDLVIAKLEWAAVSGSERQLRDVIGIVAVTETLDDAYIERWAAVLGLSDAWRNVRDGVPER